MKKIATGFLFLAMFAVPALGQTTCRATVTLDAIDAGSNFSNGSVKGEHTNLPSGGWCNVTLTRTQYRGSNTYDGGFAWFKMGANPQTLYDNARLPYTAASGDRVRYTGLVQCYDRYGNLVCSDTQYVEVTVP